MNAQIQKFMTPVQELTALNVANIEKLVNLQLEGLKEGTSASVESLKQAASIKDFEGAKNYLAGQTEAVKASVESASARAKAVAEIAQSYQAGVKKIVENTFAVG
jgi:phasin family protein